MAVALAQNVGSWRVIEKAGLRYGGIAAYYESDGLKNSPRNAAGGTAAQTGADICASWLGQGRPPAHPLPNLEPQPACYVGTVVRCELAGLRWPGALAIG
jgi:hypothetical protein